PAKSPAPAPPPNNCRTRSAPAPGSPPPAAKAAPAGWPQLPPPAAEAAPWPAVSCPYSYSWCSARSAQTADPFKPDRQPYRSSWNQPTGMARARGELREEDERQNI